MIRFLVVYLICTICITQTTFAQTNEADSCHAAAIEADENKDFLEAIRLETQALKIREKLFGRNHPEYATSIHYLARFNSDQGNCLEAIRLEKIALQIRKKLFGKKHLDYATSISNLAAYYYDSDSYSNAVRFGKDALRIRKKVLGKEHPDYATSLSNLAAYYDGLCNYSEAVRLGEEALQIRKKVLGKEHPDYASSLSNLAIYYDDLGNYSEAIRLGKEVLQIQEKNLGKENLDYASSLNNLAEYYHSLNNYSEAVRLDEEALQILEKNLGKEHPDYASSLSNLAAHYDGLGNYSVAVRLGEEVLQIQKKVLSKEHSDYAASLNNLAIYYYHLGNNSKAIRLGIKALQMLEKNIGKEHSDYANILNNLAEYNNDLGNYSEAVRIGKEVLQIRRKVLGKEHPDYAISLSNLSTYYDGLGNYFEAIRLGIKALQIRKKVLGKEHPDYAISLGNLAEYNYGLGNYSKAIRLCTDALPILKRSLGREHPEYVRSLSNLTLYYEREKTLNQCVDLIMEEFSLRKYNTLSLSQGLSKSDRDNYWSKEKLEFENRYPNLAYKYKSPIFSSIAYNSALLCKGFLLGSEIETRKIIIESNDAALVALYDSMRANQQILDKQLERPIKERCLNTDSLRETITKMERELASKSTAYGSLVANMSVEWKDVQRKLGKNDIAVEFLSFQLNKDSCMYVALTLKDGYENPKMIPLFEEKQLKSIDKNLYYKGTNIYDLVWKPLEKELEGVTNVYFSPSGELYNINIEVLPEIAGITDSRRYYRLSSTRELALTRVDNNRQNASAAIYGGLRYYCAKDSLITDSRKYPRSKNRSIEDFDLSVDSIQLRSGYGYLEGTLLEAQKVDSSAVSAKMKSSLYTDFSGTEASFKALDGQGKQLIHIATHGFYYMEKDSVRMREKGFRMLQDEGRRRYVEDKALTRSGLLFAGCNNILGGDTITLPEDVDDGILYAKEIARLDLRGLELLTLSACQTGLGDITGEGVFGLQRAFKKAGAQSILMSLWKVDDRATRLFMTRFYEDYLIRKMSKSDALLDAQKYVREYEVKMVNPDGTTSMKRKYENPDYWAAFILLDAM